MPIRWRTMTCRVWTTIRCVAAGPPAMSNSTRPPRCLREMRCSRSRISFWPSTWALASGSRGMAGGQAIDLASVGKTLSLPELEFMHIHKTGALIRAAVVLGARCGRRLDAGELERLERYAKTVGLAFQVVDDVLDCAASTATLGKTAGKDAAQAKPTYVSILGLARSRALAEELRAEAHAALAPFGATAARLRELADFIVLRRF